MLTRRIKTNGSVLFMTVDPSNRFIGGNEIVAIEVDFTYNLALKGLNL